MNSRETVLKSLNHEPLQRLPVDLGAMRSTGISAFVYPALRAALGLEQRPPVIYDTMQMLALVEADVLDELGGDVVTAFEGIDTYSDFSSWKEVDFGGRITGLVSPDSNFRNESDGSVSKIDIKGNVIQTMPDGATFFDDVALKTTFDMSADIQKVDIDKLISEIPDLTNEYLADISRHLKGLRNKTDRAILYDPGFRGLGFPGGEAAWCMTLMLEPDYAREVFEAITAKLVENIKILAPCLAGSVDVLMVAADDQGTQNAPYMNPVIYEELYVPYYTRINNAWHTALPEIKTFLHSCGSVYPLIPHFISAGFDIYNPVQWSAENMDIWKIKSDFGSDISFWGGGVDTQHTLPYKSIREIKDEVKMAIDCFAPNGGFVFCPIHNITADIQPDKIIAVYETAKNYTGY